MLPSPDVDWTEVQIEGSILARYLLVPGNEVLAELTGESRDRVDALGFTTELAYSEPKKKLGAHRAYRFTCANWAYVRDAVPAAMRSDLEARLPEWTTWILRERQRHDARQGVALELGLRAGAPLPLHRGVEHGLYPFQAAGIEWMARAGGTGIFGDDMGLGKTVQALQVLSEINARRVLVLSPPVGVLNWVREVARWAPTFRGTAVLESKKALRILDAHEGDNVLVVVSWGLADRLQGLLLERGFDTFIGDEVHYGQDIHSRRGRTLVRLAHAAEHRMGLSGTLQRNRHKDLFCPLHAIDPFAFPLFNPFAERYCGPSDIRRPDGGWVRTYTGSTRKKELGRLIRPWVLRRMKDDVLDDLPPKTISRIHLPCTDAALRSQSLELAERIRAMAETGDTKALGEISKIRQAIGLAKVPAALDWLEGMIDAGEPVVMFLYFKGVHQALLDGAKARGLRHASIVGKTTQKERDRNVEAFQNGEIDVLFGSTALRENATLHRARYTAHVDHWLVSSDIDQANDRVRRIGQKKATFHVSFHLDDTWDDEVYALVEEKRAGIEVVMDRSSIEKLLLHRILEQGRKRLRRRTA